MRYVKKKTYCVQYNIAIQSNKIKFKNEMLQIIKFNLKLLLLKMSKVKQKF